MGTNGRADHREQDMHRLPVQGLEVDRLLEEAQRHHGTGHVKDDGIPDVWNGDAVADPGGLQSLTSEEHAQQELAIDFFRDPQVLHDRAQDRLPVLPAQPIEYAASAQRFDQTGDRRRVALRFLEHGGRDVHPPRGRPLEKLCAVEAVLLVDAIRGQAALLDPPIDRLLGDAEESRDVTDTELHSSPALPSVGPYWTTMDMSRKAAPERWRRRRAPPRPPNSPPSVIARPATGAALTPPSRPAPG